MLLASSSGQSFQAKPSFNLFAKCVFLEFLGFSSAVVVALILKSLLRFCLFFLTFTSGLRISLALRLVRIVLRYLLSLIVLFLVFFVATPSEREVRVFYDLIKSSFDLVRDEGSYSTDWALKLTGIRLVISSYCFV